MAVKPTDQEDEYFARLEVERRKQVREDRHIERAEKDDVAARAPRM